MRTSPPLRAEVARVSACFAAAAAPTPALPSSPAFSTSSSAASAAALSLLAAEAAVTPQSSDAPTTRRTRAAGRRSARAPGTIRGARAVIAAEESRGVLPVKARRCIFGAAARGAW